MGDTKIDAVIDAAGHLVGILFADELPHEVAVVAFNDAAWIAQPLSSSENAVRSALEGLAHATAEGTRLDLGLAVGAEALDSAPPDRRVMVFLTDGLPNRVPLGPGGSQEETVLAAAEAARARDVVNYTIGYGQPDAPDPVDRVSAPLLQGMAGSPRRSHIAPDASSLAAVFRDIAADVLCP